MLNEWSSYLPDNVFFFLNRIFVSISQISFKGLSYRKAATFYPKMTKRPKKAQMKILKNDIFDPTFNSKILVLTTHLKV